jgi:cytochrome c553
MKLLLAAIPGLSLGLLGADSKVPPPTLPPPVERGVDFKAEVYPIFKAACFRCHGPEKQKGKYRMDTREGAFRPTEKNGPAFMAGDSKGSAAVLMMAGLIDEMQMPPPGGKPGESDPLTAEQVGIIRAWIDQGAEWPDGPIAEVQKPVAFDTDVRPILAAACGSCHSGASAEGAFRTDSAASVIKGGAGYGAAVIQGSPGKSPLITIVSGKDEDIPKPERHRLPDKQVQTLREWIQQGAK